MAAGHSSVAPLVSILTPTIPGREDFLEECKASVSAQIVALFGQPDIEFEHLIWTDLDGDGCAVTMNRLARMAAGEWLLPLADDDLLLPSCLLRLLRHIGSADVIYSPPLVTGNEDRWWFYQAPPVIPSFALIRKRLWDDLDGYTETLRHEEDRDFWVRALAAEARFVRVDEPCWIYRQWKKADGTPGNKSFAKAVA